MNQRSSELTEFKLKFLNQEYIIPYMQLVLGWLSSDFKEKGKPERHFWRHRSVIYKSFSQCRALVVLDQDDKLAAYLIWDRFHLLSIKINLVEVIPKYRRQGLFKKMQEALIIRFPEVLILTASVRPEADHVFSQDGWQKNNNQKNNNQNLEVLENLGVLENLIDYYKIVKPVVDGQDSLPDGLVIALSSKALNKVKNNRAKYEASLRYFPIQVDDHQQLEIPMVTQHHDEGYVGLYFNRKLITEGQSKDLFQLHDHDGHILKLAQFKLKDFSLLFQLGIKEIGPPDLGHINPHNSYAVNQYLIHGEGLDQAFSRFELTLSYYSDHNIISGFNGRDYDLNLYDLDDHHKPSFDLIIMKLAARFPDLVFMPSSQFRFRCEIILKANLIDHYTTFWIVRAKKYSFREALPHEKDLVLFFLQEFRKSVKEYLDEWTGENRAKLLGYNKVTMTHAYNLNDDLTKLS